MCVFGGALGDVICLDAVEALKKKSSRLSSSGSNSALTSLLSTQYMSMRTSTSRVSGGGLFLLYTVMRVRSAKLLDTSHSMCGCYYRGPRSTTTATPRASAPSHEPLSMEPLSCGVFGYAMLEKDRVHFT